MSLPWSLGYPEWLSDPSSKSDMVCLAPRQTSQGAFTVQAYLALDLTMATVYRSQCITKAETEIDLALHPQIA
jgi:hypothetical protein